MNHASPAQRAALEAFAGGLLAGAQPPEAAMWASVLGEDAHLRVGNRPPATCRAGALAELAWLFGPMGALGTRFAAIWAGRDGETVLVETDFVTVADGSVWPLAFVLRATGARLMIRDLRFYLDPGPLSRGGDGRIIQ